MIFFSHSLITFAIFSVAISGIFADLEVLRTACQNILRDCTSYKNNANDFGKNAEVLLGGAIVGKLVESSEIVEGSESGMRLIRAILVQGYELVQNSLTGGMLDINHSSTGAILVQVEDDHHACAIHASDDASATDSDARGTYQLSGYIYPLIGDIPRTTGGMRYIKWIDIWLSVCYGLSVKNISRNEFVKKLRDHYKSYVSNPANIGDPYQPFKSFCEEKIQTTDNNNTNLFFTILQQI